MQIAANTDLSTPFRRPPGMAMLLAAWGLAGGFTYAVTPPSLDTPELPWGQGSRSASASENTDEEIRLLVSRLDAPRFASRKLATRELIAEGRTAIPHLVEALATDSSEVRYRASLILGEHNSFEDVAPHLVDAVDKRFGYRARVLLREQAMWQVEAVCNQPHSDKLFKFWGIRTEEYRNHVRTELDKAKTASETSKVVTPLLGIREKVTLFNDALARLEAMGLSYDHQHSPGYVIAETLARGLGENRRRWVDFAEKYVGAFETLASKIRLETSSTHTLRKAVSERATMSSSAAGYLVQVLDEASPQRAVLSQRIGISPEWLEQEFCGGLASTDATAWHRRVGKIHIVDMLTRAISQWPDAPHDGVVATLIADTKKTVVDGDKPKALALLDALNACRDLSKHGLDIRDGPGKRLAERLCHAAVEAANNRVYHPARSLHDRFLRLIDRGVAPDHQAFPRQLYEDYLAKTAAATSDDQRLTLDRYLRILENLDAAGLNLEQPGVERFTLAMRDCVTRRHDLLAAGVTELDRLLREAPGNGEAADSAGIARALREWTDQQVPDDPH
jgi:hypothetical protein